MVREEKLEVLARLEVVVRVRLEEVEVVVRLEAVAMVEVV